jgi:hypothetical protein
VYDEIRWANTHTVIKASEPTPEIDDIEDDEELAAGNSILRAIAAQSEGRIVEIADGVWRDTGSGPGWADPRC